MFSSRKNPPRPLRFTREEEKSVHALFAWTPFLLKLAAIIFVFGMGWQRLEAMQTRVVKIEAKYEGAAGVGERLAAIETKLDLILTRKNGGFP